MWPKASFDQISKFHFPKLWETNSIMWKYRQRAFIWMVTSYDCVLRLKKLESPYKTPSNTLAVKGLIVVRGAGARVAQWWEPWPPTNVALVQILASMPYVVCGLSLFLVLSFAPRCFSPGTLVFSSPQLKPTFPKSNSTRNGRQRTNVIICYF